MLWGRWVKRVDKVKGIGRRSAGIAVISMKPHNGDGIGPSGAHFTIRRKYDFTAWPEYRPMALTSDALVRNLSELV